ncbi:hypothetical protein V8E54_007296 [Elaphomyces granulatus]
MKAERRRGEEGQVIHSTHCQEIWRSLGNRNKAELSHHLRVCSSKIIAATGSIARHALMVQLSSSTLIPIDFNHVCIRRQR